jgi:hypothetical protein
MVAETPKTGYYTSQIKTGMPVITTGMPVEDLVQSRRVTGLSEVFKPTARTDVRTENVRTDRVINVSNLLKDLNGKINNQKLFNIPYSTLKNTDMIKTNDKNVIKNNNDNNDYYDIMPIENIKNENETFSILEKGK